jgi:hypothetical protein
MNEEGGMDTSAETAPEQPDDDAPVEADTAVAPPAPVQPTTATPTTVQPTTAKPTPILPTQSSEDTDVGWGDYRERDDDDHLLRDRPPHWDNA